MNQLLGLISTKVLADGGIFELLGPLLLFGIYAIGALAKKWASSQDSGEKPSEELQKAVREKYKEIHARQTGKKPEAPKFQPQRKPELTRPASRLQKFERPAPVRQVTEKQTAYPVQIQRQHRSVRQTPRTEPRYRPKTSTVKTRTPKPVHAQKHKNVPVTKAHKQPESTLMTMLRQPQNLRSAIVLKEILDKPVSMRGLY